MKYLKYLIMVAAIAFAASGCDRIRAFLDMPTSVDLEYAREIKERQMAEQKAKSEAKDTISIRDSVSGVKDSLKSGESVTAPTGTTSVKRSTARYSVIIGSFKVEANALSLAEKFSKLGYKPEILLFKNGFHAVSASSAESEGDARIIRKKIIDDSLMEEDLVWIYDKLQKLHTEK